MLKETKNIRIKNEYLLINLLCYKGFHEVHLQSNLKEQVVYTQIISNH